MTDLEHELAGAVDATDVMTIAEALWTQHAELRDEFTSKDAFVAYCRALHAGRARTHPAPPPIQRHSDSNTVPRGNITAKLRDIRQRRTVR